LASTIIFIEVDMTDSTFSVVERIVEGSPVIVAVLSMIGVIVWRTWREERKEMLEELREERESRAKSHEQMLAVVDRSTEAIHAVREALAELRHAIKENA
jgi:beta-phosphoglucomutase-like phosphatase (HAD superfamily)